LAAPSFESRRSSHFEFGTATPRSFVPSRSTQCRSWLAEEGLTLLFDRRGIGPSSAQVRLYEVFLVLGSAVQCLVLGIAVQAGLIVLRRRRFRAP